MKRAPPATCTKTEIINVMNEIVFLNRYITIHEIAVLADIASTPQLFDIHKLPRNEEIDGGLAFLLICTIKTECQLPTNCNWANS